MNPSRPDSLRRQLVRLATVAILVIGLLSTALVYQRAHHEADELLDTQLAQVAETLLAIAAGGDMDRFAGAFRRYAHRYVVPVAFEIWRGAPGAGRRLVVSPDHAGFALPIAAGYSDRMHRDKHWRLFAVVDVSDGYTVVVGQRHSARARMARETGLILLLPMLLALPLMAFAVKRIVAHSLRPVDALTREIATLDAQALAPLDTAAPLPAELAPLRDAFNRLIERVATALDNERRFTADAAHELRTPLAALKVQAQVARRAPPGGTQQHTLDQVIAGVDRMARLVEQLLTLARIEPTQLARTPSFDPAPALARLCAARADAAAQRGQILSAELASGCRVSMEPGWLDIAVRNLIDNAINYAAAGARIDVSLRATDAGCTLRVADDGPGVPAELRARLGARFLRGDTEVEGCGLGLSIVERIAVLSHARLEFGDGLTRADGGAGFAASLHFSRPAAAD